MLSLKFVYVKHQVFCNVYNRFKLIHYLEEVMSRVHSLAVEYREQAVQLSKTIEGYSQEAVKKRIFELYSSFGSPRQKASLLKRFFAGYFLSEWPAEAYQELLNLEVVDDAFDIIDQVKAGARVLESRANFKDYLSRLAEFKVKALPLSSGLRDRKHNVARLDKAYRRALSKNWRDQSVESVSVAREAREAAVEDLHSFHKDALLVLEAEFGAAAVKSNGLVQYFGLSL